MAQKDIRKPHLAKFYRNQQGKDFIEYPGLLAEFHMQNDQWMAEHPGERDSRGIRSVLVQMPTPENGNTAIAAAVVTMSSGASYSDIGDANDTNLNKVIATARCRMASTRAKGRALRDAVNIGTTMYEELPDAESGDLDEHEPAGRAAAEPVFTPPKRPLTDYTRDLCAAAFRLYASRMLGIAGSQDELLKDGQAAVLSELRLNPSSWDHASFRRVVTWVEEEIGMAVPDPFPTAQEEELIA